jgi:hypothetical protein
VVPAAPGASVPFRTGRLTTLPMIHRLEKILGRNLNLGRRDLALRLRAVLWNLLLGILLWILLGILLRLLYMSIW